MKISKKITANLKKSGVDFYLSVPCKLLANMIDILEQDLPIVTNSDGTIAKYRIDISTNFVLFDIVNNKEIFSDYSKGFAQYETQTNNYDTEQKRDEAKKIATSNSLQLIPIKIQNFQSRKSE